MPKPSHPEMLALIRERLRGLEARQAHRAERRRRIRAREREKEQAREQQQVEFWEKQAAG